ncbi:decaprenyl diphosphate synthase [Neoasaia chiangmaiensis NBRC 101099]|uniref:Octaprenyl diphosphate synthase n=1 Tax=Neoasaia chiangmaiensis TaxID=320497 RepID=A0A1U9KNB2_9PROT|nr:farnesyltranstransferase [Neoasaia chiangmaiensis]GBR38476.1 decaprenyl diphosphate synthase [Neoasaia chiangmaiensis NBRC 101099]GEN15879.1 farnesyltranstransferase [Neoasaia chiangmaiensis]
MGAADSLTDAKSAEATVGERSASAPNALNALAAYLKDDMEACNREIVARMQSPVPLIPQLGAHLVAAGGKRLRPLLTLAAAHLCGYAAGPDRQRHIGLAACVEFIHTATLLHDDVVDESTLRRGLASANAVFGNKASVLVGDFLFARAFQLMTADGSLRVMEILSSASATIAEGEVLQMATQNDLSTPIEKYLEVIHGKTAALFAAACRVGAVVAARPDAEEQALEDFGTNLGMAFQLVDDALDYAADQQVLGKTVGDDMREGKITLPVLAAYQAADEEGRAFWQRVIEEGEQTDADLPHALDLIAKTDSINITLARAKRYAEDAVAALSVFPDTPVRKLLIDTAFYTVNRVH